MSGERKGKNRGRSHTTPNSSVDGNGDVEFSFVFLSSSSLILAVVAIRRTALSFDEESQHTPSFLFLAAVLSRQCVRRILRLVCVVTSPIYRTRSIIGSDLVNNRTRC